MKYAPLPLLAAVPHDKAGDVVQPIVDDFLKSPAAQVLSFVLRCQEQAALQDLRSGTPDHDRVQRMIGRLNTIEEIRNSFAAMASNPQSAEWHDEESEEFLEPQRTT